MIEESPVRYDSWRNLPAMFFDVMEQVGDRPLLWSKRDGRWSSVSGAEAARQVAGLAGFLGSIGVGRGDRVMLVAENRPEWAIADLAIMAAGAVSVPAYVTNQVGDHRHVMSDSGAKALIVSTPALAERALAAAADVGGLDAVIMIEPPAGPAGANLAVHPWPEALAARNGAGAEAAARAATIARSETACLIYTSGTGGVPKGVMLSHGAILCNCKGAHRLMLELGLTEEVFLSFLPLSHAYEHTAGLMFPLSIGAQIYYAEGVDKLAGNMAEVRPTIMTAVPRLYETMHGRITRGVAQQGGFKARLFDKAVELGARRVRGERPLSAVEKIVDAALDRLVRAKVRARFGGRLKALVSGGAPLNHDIGVFFTALGLKLLQGYGQTESAPIVSCNPPSRVRLETVGPPLVDVEVGIAEDGEILVRGELVMSGYWGDDAATAETVRDGWLHTGDIGEIDPDGYIRITDRKKDIIVNSGGDNVSPQRVEGFLTMQPEIAQAMVHGDRKPHLVALVVPESEFARDWARQAGKPAEIETLVEDADFRAVLGEAVERANADLAPIERVRRFMVRAEPFTIENEQLTPSLKIRRHKITDAHRDDLESLYAR